MPIIIDTHGLKERRHIVASSMAPKFEARWLEEEGCKDIIREAWEKEVGVNQKEVSQVVRGVMLNLVDWNKNVLGDLEKRISRLKKELEVWRKKPIGPDQVRREELLRFKLSRLEEKKRVILEAKSAC